MWTEKKLQEEPSSSGLRSMKWVSNIQRGWGKYPIYFHFLFFLMPQLPSKPRVETVTAMTAASLFQSEGTVVSRGWCDRLCTFNNFLSSCRLASDADVVTETCRTERGSRIPSFWLEDQGEPWGNW